MAEDKNCSKGLKPLLEDYRGQQVVKQCRKPLPEPAQEKSEGSKSEQNK